MNFNICFLCCIVLSFEPINTSSYRRFRRQMNAFQNNNPSLNSRSIHSKIPSGSITGTAYYGTASDLNYGSFIPRPNRPGGSDVIPISYNPSSGYYQQMINPNHAHQQPQWYHKNNAWQNVYTNNRNDVNRYYNRYEQGNQGWYLTGDSPSFNRGLSVMTHRCLSSLAIIILVFCK